MSQNSNNHQPVLEAAEQPPEVPYLADENEVGNEFADAPSPLFSADAYANSLMDEVFADVDRILNGGANLPTAPVQPDYVTLEPVSISAIPKLNLPSVFMPRRPLSDDSLDAELDEATAKVINDLASSRSNQSIDRLLLAIACASLVATGALWFFLQNRTPTAVAPSPAETAAALQAQQDAEFLDYMARSVSRIDRTASSQTALIPPAAPPVRVQSNPEGQPAPNAGPNVIERVYIPLYQPPQTLFPGAQSAAPAAPIAPAPAPAAPSAAVAPPNIAPSATHVLVGVLELGERSAALFEINGTPQRVYVGENIGSSGWALVSIANQEAIVRRNGEVRSIYVGQRF